MTMYRSNNFDGDVAASRNIACGGNLTAQGSAAIGRDLIVKGWLDAPNIVGPCKGLFLTETALAEAYPRPRPGLWALVGADLPARLYTAQSGAWVDTGRTAGSADIPLSSLRAEIEELRADTSSIGPAQIARTLTGMGPSLIRATVEGKYVINGGVSSYPTATTNGYADCDVEPGTVIEWMEYQAISFYSSTNNFFCFYADDWSVVACRAVNSGGAWTVPGLRSMGGKAYRMEVPAGATRFRFNYGGGDDYYCREAYDEGSGTATIPWLVIDSGRVAGLGKAAAEAADGPHCWHAVRRPMSLAGKRVAVFGDSIAYGVASPGLQQLGQLGFAAQLCAKAGAVMENYAVSGTKIADPALPLSICNKALAYQGSPDAVIVAGGTNDWHAGVELGEFGSDDPATFYGALELMCRRFDQALPQAEVVFVTPIPRTAPEENSPLRKAPLDDYRRAIYEVATAHGHSVVSGLGLGLPRRQGPWADALIANADGVHPTALGHRRMADALASLLL